jgi:hypothetical protein
MTPKTAASPLGPTALVDEYFIENRNRLIEVAAFLDRLDRAGGATRDFRMQVLAEAIAVLGGTSPNRVAEIQMLLSDPHVEPLTALDRKGAVGAYDRSLKERRS